MKILVFAGTKNGRELIHALAENDYDVIVSSMSEYGHNLIPKYKKIKSLYGKMNEEDIIQIIRNEKIEQVIDATHPYAEEISNNIIIACKITNTKLLRFERESSISQQIGIHFKTMEEACSYLKKKEGNILFTTGVNGMNYVVNEIYNERVYFRIAPMVTSIDIAHHCNLPDEHMIIKKPPYDTLENLKHVKKYDIKYLVTKDSGYEGNTEEKIIATKLTNISLLVIDRPNIKYKKSYYHIKDILIELSTYN